MTDARAPPWAMSYDNDVIYPLLTGGGTMQINWGFRRRPSSTTYWAGVLLLILLAHLAFMSSSWHAEPMAEDRTALALTAMWAQTGSLLSGEAWAVKAEHASHCAIAWAAPQRLWSSVGLSTVLSTWDGLLPHQPASSQLWARVLGPPTFVDPQALLQVFRF